MDCYQDLAIQTHNRCPILLVLIKPEGAHFFLGLVIRTWGLRYISLYFPSSLPPMVVSFIFHDNNFSWIFLSQLNPVSVERLNEDRAGRFWRKSITGKCWQWLQSLLKVTCEIDSKRITPCGGLALAGCQVPT